MTCHSSINSISAEKATKPYNILRSLASESVATILLDGPEFRSDLTFPLHSWPIPPSLRTLLRLARNNPLPSSARHDIPLPLETRFSSSFGYIVGRPISSTCTGLRRPSQSQSQAFPVSSGKLTDNQRSACPPRSLPLTLSLLDIITPRPPLLHSQPRPCPTILMTITIIYHPPAPSLHPRPSLHLLQQPSTQTSSSS